MGKAKLLPNINHIIPLRPHSTFPHIKLKVPETHIRITTVEFHFSYLNLISTRYYLSERIQITTHKNVLMIHDEKQRSLLQKQKWKKKKKKKKS